MIRWMIPPAGLALVFSVIYYPREEAPATLAALAPPGPVTYAARSLVKNKVSLPEARLVRAALVTETTDPRPALDPREADRHWRAITQLEKCADDETGCGLPQTDSRAAQFAVRDGLLKEARYFIEHRPGSAAEARRSYRAARHLLKFPDEAVRGASLEWILTLPAENGTIRALRDSLSDMIDPDLVRLSFAELKRHLGGEEEDAAVSFAGQILLAGGIFASREAASLLPTLRTERNEGKMREWLAELPPESTKARLLREGLTAAKGGI